MINCSPGDAVSLVVPIRDEASAIADLASTVRGQTVAPAEVILVDGGSRDHSVALLRRENFGRAKKRILELGPAHPGAARNAGIRVAHGDWVALTDCGVCLSPEWLESLLQVALQTGADVVFGHYESNVVSIFDECYSIAFLDPVRRRAAGSMRAPSIASAMFKRSAWARIGEFEDWRAGEDLELLGRILGDPTVSIAWAPSARVKWQAPTTVSRAFDRFAKYSRANLAAGRWRTWHLGVFRFWALTVLLGVGGVTYPLLLGAIPVLFLARAGKAVWRARRSWQPSASRIIGVGFLQVVGDVATIRGAFRWLRDGAPRYGARIESRRL